ncbi:hypothetical protein G9A89_010577 [Geosiphon pyriformis]|nr:hypothetical protein G9A89_010577 [Geosiphon pyriformis]
MEPASSVAGGSGSTSAVDVRVIDLSAGPLGLANISDANESEASSVSSLLDLENLKNTITEETSYTNSNASVVNNIEDNTTPKKTCTRTYVLSKPPKTLLFDILSDNNNMVALLSPKFTSSKKLHSIGSCALEKRIFNSVKSFALNIRTSALSSKTIGDKLIAVKKIFYQVNSFGGASAPLKFPGIIRFSFTSELSLIKAKELVVSEKILVNIDVRKPNIHSNWEVIVKEIPMDLFKLAIESVFSKFGHVILIRIQLIGLWQKALMEFESLNVASLVASKWLVLMNCYRTLLYTFPIGTTAYDLLDLVNSYGGKTCFIGHNLSSYVCNRCAIVCFADKASKLAAIAGLSLVHHTKCECFSHISNMCLVGRNSGVRHKRVVSSQDQICLANIYKRKQTPVTRLVSFGEKTWTQVIISVVELNNKPVTWCSKATFVDDVQKVWYLKVLVNLKILLWNSLYNEQRFNKVDSGCILK